MVAIDGQSWVLDVIYSVLHFDLGNE